MIVICPSCGFDAGDILEVEVGMNVECECGFQWPYKAIEQDPELIERSSQAKKIAMSILKTSSNMANIGINKFKSHIAKKRFTKNLPSIFLEAASDGIITQQEEREIRDALKTHGISWTEAVSQIKPLTRDFVRRVLADIISDSKVTKEERQEIVRYISLFDLKDMMDEIDAVLDRVDTLWKLNNGILPKPLIDAPLWLRSGEGLYLKCSGRYLRKMRNEYKEIIGDLYITNTRFEFISPDFTFSHPHEQLRKSHSTRRTHLALLFHPKSGSGTYLVADAPIVAAYLNALARSANRTISISRESDGTVKQRRRIPKEVRHEVWIRDEGQCIECGAEDYIEFDHVIPVTKGGANTTNNIQLLCRRCNGKKSDKI